MAHYGYGKVLEIDLATGSAVKREIPAQFAQEFLGGMGFSSKILYDEVKPDVDPISLFSLTVRSQERMLPAQAELKLLPSLR
jgi:aldehyde:ferredoxin oxidoreductase